MNNKVPPIEVPTIHPRQVEDTDGAGVMHAALIRVALPMLPIVLRMPEGSVVDGFYMDPHYPDRAYLRVRHPSLPRVEQGQRLREMDLELYEDGRPSVFRSVGGGIGGPPR